MTRNTFVAAIALACISLCLAGAPASAAGSPIAVTHPWLRATPNHAPVAGGYATITNTGGEPDTLVSASLPMAPEGQIHTMTMDKGVMRMRRLDDGLTVAAGATVTLQPGGDHLMFIKPTAPLKEGGTVSGTLVFKKAGAVPVTFAIGGMAAKSAPGTAPAAGHAHGGADPHGAHGMDGMDMH